MFHLWALNQGNWQYFGTRPLQSDNINPGVFDSLASIRRQGLSQFFLVVAIFAP